MQNNKTTQKHGYYKKSEHYVVWFVKFYFSKPMSNMTIYCYFTCHFILLLGSVFRLQNKKFPRKFPILRVHIVFRLQNSPKSYTNGPYQPYTFHLIASHVPFYNTINLYSTNNILIWGTAFE